MVAELEGSTPPMSRSANGHDSKSQMYLFEETMQYKYKIYQSEIHLKPSPYCVTKHNGGDTSKDLKTESLFGRLKTLPI